MNNNFNSFCKIDKNKVRQAAENCIKSISDKRLQLLLERRENLAKPYKSWFFFICSRTKAEIDYIINHEEEGNEWGFYPDWIEFGHYLKVRAEYILKIVKNTSKNNIKIYGKDIDIMDYL